MKKQIILFGAGGCGTNLSQQLLEEHDIEVLCFCDNDHNKIGTEINGKKVLTISDAGRKYSNFTILISIYDKSEHDRIKEQLSALGYIDNVISYSLKYHELFQYLFPEKDLVTINRKICADCHAYNMDKYFEDAESDRFLDVFWQESSPFYVLFNKLDLTNCIELACGHGRHVQKYIDKAGHITLVDILKKNIDLCKERFAPFDYISYYCNNGFNLNELSSDSYTALFTYDAMVHFESIDIYSYLCDIHRVLMPGGRALFHHSNFYDNYKASFINAYNPHGRNFMSDRLFAHFADRAGFKILEQKVIDWGGSKNLDCITLVEK